MHIVVVASQKGGAGKTSLMRSLAVARVARVQRICEAEAVCNANLIAFARKLGMRV